ncbi:MAG: hypothetical protein A3E85_00250 [Gammaproteobacteria bacterium RIFCSPHIGHO2_12_FULL_45_12]|nr:MAG: hypothetical protein A3E85_00250 [Gammaproteobacteria bacterium RIFCSPHIGHO2_12_FULL_45_12]
MKGDGIATATVILGLLTSGLALAETMPVPPSFSSGSGPNQTGTDASGYTHPQPTDAGGNLTLKPRPDSPSPQNAPLSPPPSMNVPYSNDSTTDQTQLNSSVQSQSSYPVPETPAR